MGVRGQFFSRRARHRDCHDVESDMELDRARQRARVGWMAPVVAYARKNAAAHGLIAAVEMQRKAPTADASSTRSNAADVLVVLQQAREARPHNLAPTMSSLMQLAHYRRRGSLRLSLL